MIPDILNDVEERRHNVALLEHLEFQLVSLRDDVVDKRGLTVFIAPRTSASLISFRAIWAADTLIRTARLSLGCPPAIAIYTK
jgi:hypothetical protein